jgi:Xaa-Pro aminopeptidase
MYLYSWDPCLYRAEGDVKTFVQGQGYEVKIEIYDTAAKIKEISAYTFHPNKTTWWNTIVNWFIELFYGKTAVLVSVEGEPNALYVRVDDLSRVLNISSKDVQGAAKEEDVTDFIVKHQMRQTAEKIKALAEEEVGHILNKMALRNSLRSLDIKMYLKPSITINSIQNGWRVH